MNPRHLNLLRLIAAVITVLLILGQNYLPQKSIDIFLQSDLNTSLYSDGEFGGSSEVAWVDQENFHWKCILRKSNVYPVCGLSINFSQIPYKTIDAEQYSSMQIALEYKGPAKKARIFLRNHNDLYSNLDNIDSTKFHFVNLRISDLDSEVDIDMTEFSVADWWKDNSDVSRSLSKPEFSGLVAIGIDQASPEVYGEHEYKLKSIRFSGEWISAETLYFLLILGWMLIIGFEAIKRFLYLRERNQHHANRLSELRLESDKYKELSNTDALTGVSNRVGFAKRLNAITDGDNDQLLGYALMVLDIDHFKAVNDEHGHDVGDKVLKEFAEKISTFIRADDSFARWGGEEFVILAHVKNPGSENVLAEKIRTKIEETGFLDSSSIKLTLSIGVATTKLGESFDELFKRADKNLYKAKRGGRNQVVYDS